MITRTHGFGGFERVGSDMTRLEYHGGDDGPSQRLSNPERDAAGHVEISASPHPESPLAIHPKNTPERLAITRNKSQLPLQSPCVRIPPLNGRREFVKVRSVGLVAGCVNSQAVRGKKRAYEESRGSSSSLPLVPIEQPIVKKRM